MRLLGESDKLDGCSDKVLDGSVLESNDGEELGILDKLDENKSDGIRVGCEDGKLEGSLLDMIDGINVGLNEDIFVGILDGSFETITVGKVVGC